MWLVSIVVVFKWVERRSQEKLCLPRTEKLFLESSNKINVAFLPGSLGKVY